jgi:hypothetical protein
MPGTKPNRRNDMSELNITINDTLSERLESLLRDVREHVAEYIEEHKPDRAPGFIELDNSGDLQEMIDCAVPIEDGEIRDIWYVHADELLSAYQDDGIGDGTEPNLQQVAIYCWLEQKLADELDDLVEEIHDAWLESNDEDDA